tara:strand:+ start:217 stop:447 length:231 start_codon:yes stop_codon:yes gene_type:complete
MIINLGVKKMIEVFDIKNNKLFKLPDHELERVCLHIVGGGLTDIQTAQAMLYAHKLRKNGKLTAKGYQIKITEVIA